MSVNVECSEDHGMISFDWGRCALRASAGMLTLRAEAIDHEHLRMIEQRLADRLEGVGRRDHLTVTWTSAHGADDRAQKRTVAHDPGHHTHG
jgi:hypothetical protein